MPDETDGTDTDDGIIRMIKMRGKLMATLSTTQDLVLTMIFCENALRAESRQSMS